MDFTTEKIQTLLDPKQGLRAVGLGQLEDLNIKQLQKVAEEVNKIYRIKGYKALSKAKLVDELKTRFPHLVGEEGKLEDLSLKQIQAITIKYQQQYLIKNINKMNKAQLIEAIRRVAPHLEGTPDVRLATPEPSPEPEEEPEPEPQKSLVSEITQFNERYKYFKANDKHLLWDKETDRVLSLSGEGVGFKTKTGYTEGGAVDEPSVLKYVLLIPNLKKKYEEELSKPSIITPEPEPEPEPKPLVRPEPEPKPETEEEDDGLVEAREVKLDGKTAYLDDEGDIMNEEGDILAEKGEYIPDYPKLRVEQNPDTYYYYTENEIDIVYNGIPNEYYLEESGVIYDRGTKIVAEPGEYTWVGGNEFEPIVSPEEEKQTKSDTGFFLQDIEQSLPGYLGSLRQQKEQDRVDKLNKYLGDNMLIKFTANADYRNPDDYIRISASIVNTKTNKSWGFEDVYFHKKFRRALKQLDTVFEGIDKKIVWKNILITADYLNSIDKQIEPYPRENRYMTAYFERKGENEFLLPSGKVVKWPRVNVIKGGSGNFIVDYQDSDYEDLVALTKKDKMVEVIIEWPNTRSGFETTFPFYLLKDWLLGNL